MKNKKILKLFRLAIDLMTKKEHLNIDGMRKIISIRASMNRKSLNKLNEYFSDIIPWELCFKVDNVIKDPYWLTGFVDAEGCFYIKPRKMKLFPQERFNVSFRLSQHWKDTLLMNNISTFLNCGLVELSTTKKMARFVVNKFSDNMNKIIPFFKKYPLLSVKRLDFQDFCKISCILKEKKILNQEDILKIQDIKSKMNRGRKNFEE